ncbi:hypothetical protein K9M42_00195 [Patescibacteria group bacterium]|nr:hypothetical protein [Patescibacteria group bacterium]
MQYIDKNKINISLKKALKTIISILPIFLGTILLISLLNSIISKEFYLEIFQKGNLITNSFLGSIIGGISIGTPVLSYIIGGELLNNGIHISAITAFLVSWVTIGVIQIPLEASIFGKRFTIYRNLFAFLFSILIGILIYLILSIL